jgi:hypothetical protein
MKTLQSLMGLIALMFLAGCVMPAGMRTTAGHRFKDEEIAFLDLAGTDRGEVLSTLGTPLWDSAESKVLLYYWQRAAKYNVTSVEPASTEEICSSVAGAMCPDLKSCDVSAPVTATQSSFTGKRQNWVLFVSYDELGLVRKYEVRRVGSLGNPEELCQQWRRKGR